MQTGSKRLIRGPKGYLRKLLKDTYIWDLRELRKDRALAATWEEQGRPVPPPEFIKRVTIADFASAFATQIFIETGTFMGGAVHALKRRFKALYSIELSIDLAEKAKQRFQPLPHIHILQGDNAQVLPQIMGAISTPCLFWLDGHYSGGITARSDLDTPILRELQTILDHKCKNHVILIDDARLFDGTRDYPEIGELRELFAKERPNYDFSVVNDVIRIHPARVVTTTY